MGIVGAIIWVIGSINLLTRPPNPPSRGTLQRGFQGGSHVGSNIGLRASPNWGIVRIIEYWCEYRVPFI